MEEYPSHTLRKILVDYRSSRNGNGKSELMDAATKTGKWLHYFHHHIHTPAVTPYSANDILDLVREYAERLESYSRGRVKAQTIMNSFADKLKNVQIDSIVFSQSHADMTCDNVLYSDDGKVCVIDIKTRPAPVYSDLGLILTHPETFKSQIFSGGTYFSESLLKEYRDAIIAGYFEDEPVDEFMVKLFSAIKVVDKWTMYEELMNRYKGLKHLLAVPVGPFVTAYFQSVLKKHLDSISTADIQQPVGIAKPVDPAI
jgi:thiamine kinase-like enzyme